MIFMVVSITESNWHNSVFNHAIPCSIHGWCPYELKSRRKYLSRRNFSSKYSEITTSTNGPKWFPFETIPNQNKFPNSVEWYRKKAVFWSVTSVFGCCGMCVCLCRVDGVCTLTVILSTDLFGLLCGEVRRRNRYNAEQTHTPLQST